MHILFLFFPIILLVMVIRLVTLPFRIARRRRYYGGYDGGYNPYRYGGRRHRFGGLGTILALVALDRIFTGRRF